VAKEAAVNLVVATSGQQLYAVVNSACMSERRSDETHRYLESRNTEILVGLNDTLKAVTSALLPVAASGD